jgi:hypothetical protein
LVDVMDNLQPEDDLSPIKDLLDKIEKLKEKMESLFGKLSPVTNQDRLRRSGQRYYQAFNPDPSFILFGGNKNPIRSRSRYV